MSTFFLTCALLGGGLLVLQFILAAFGIGDDDGLQAVHDLNDNTGGAPHEGLHLFSLRALSAAVAFFGIGGMLGLATPLGLFAAVPLAVLFGGAAMIGVAAAMRAMLRLEDDGTVQVEGAIGLSGDVYLSIPPARGGVGKIHVVLQNRLVELQAVTTHTDALPTGARILVIDVVGPDTVDVVPDPAVLPSSEVPHAAV
ncbi:MAG TPA: hypothetical protein VHL59_08670 [Thermoanaerobaculia bacterium]|nr:hypothetical protein [Thermoanaerobaculia bacterium]